MVKSLFYVIGAILLAGALYFALRSPPAAEEPAPVLTPAPGTQTLRPQLGPAPNTGVSETVAPMPGPVPPTGTLYAQPNAFDIVVRGGKLMTTLTQFKVHQGDAVTLRVTADVNDEFHLHGYDLTLKVTPDARATLHFVADKTGRFECELHESKLKLGAVEVYPKDTKL